MSEGAVADLCEAFWEAEAEFGLLDWSVHGVRVWEAGRVPLYYDLQRQMGTFTATGDPANRVENYWSRVVASVRSNPLVGRAHADAVVFESRRSVEVEGRFVCPYTFQLVRDLADRGESVLLFDRVAPGQRPKSIDPRRRSLDFVDLCRRIGAQLPSSLCFGRADIALIAAVEARLSARFGLLLNARRALALRLGKFVLERAVFRRLLRRRRPSSLYCVSAYGGLASLIAAARELGIRTIEVQHGVISRYHIGYSYPNRDFATLAYFPDQFYTWGAPWDELMDAPVPSARLVPFGFHYFDYQVGKLRGVPRQPRRILLLSQGALGRVLSETILRSVDRLRDSHIVYRLHPRERTIWRTYPALVELSKLPNVTVQEGGDLYETMLGCEWQVGIYSTALHEGLALGLKTALVDLPGIEYMAKWFERGHAIRFEEMVDRLALTPTAT